MHPPTPSAKSGREYFFLVYIYCISRFSNGRRCGKELGLQKLFNIVPRSQNGVYDTIFSGNVTGINCLAFKMVLDCRNSCAQLSGFGNLNCCRGFDWSNCNGWSFYWHYHFLQCICIFINLNIVCILNCSDEERRNKCFTLHNYYNYSALRMWNFWQR